MGYPQVGVRRAVQRDRRSDGVRLAREPQLRALRQRDARSRQSPHEVRRLSVPTWSSIRSTRPTRAATSRSTASGPATRSPTSCSAIRASSQVGIGRADEHGRSTWFHAYGQDDWKIRSNLTLNYGLRYEINSQMADVDNRLSSIDLPGPPFRHRQRRRTATSRRRRRRCCPQIPIAVRRRPKTPAGRGGCCVRAICASRRASASSGRLATTARRWSTPDSACS